ncbi:hypothetical protein QBC46DRAFT_308858 [Diplogelasinospora grovesii]|uniref:BTB domain-containing protein n=1 Tax=Diplogelasinospora grovesii TaxID=303347 RepID=A0AAN6NBB0_9PEZI|nr:hypothetical protein QBC46DRAFT_308858 [Diplogelasinospora grovesii]
MDSISHESIVSSKPIRFSVGSQGRDFTMHSALVAHQSPVLERLTNGPFREAHEAHVTWDHVDERTFVRFSQFAYTGDYDGGQNLHATHAEDPASIDFDDQGSSILQSGKKKKPKKSAWSVMERPSPILSKRDQLWEEFKSTCTCPASYDSQARAAKEAPEDKTDFFLSHARLYVFAQCYGVSGLETLALYRLQQSLATFELRDERVGDIVELLRYCYEDAVPDQLRSLVVLYVACNVKKLWESSEFQELLKTHSELSTPLIGTLLKRLD